MCCDIENMLNVNKYILCSGCVYMYWFVWDELLFSFVFFFLSSVKLSHHLALISYAAAVSVLTTTATNTLTY